MNIEKPSPWLQVIGNLAVLAGLVLLAVEIHQNTVLVRAQLESDATAGWIDIDASKQGDNFAEVLARAIEDPENLTLGDMVALDGYLFTYIDQLVQHEELLELGLTKDPLEGLVAGSLDDFFGNRFAQAWWRETRHKFGAALVDAVDQQLPAISPDQDFEYFHRIRSRLESEG